MTKYLELEIGDKFIEEKYGMKNWNTNKWNIMHNLSEAIGKALDCKSDFIKIIHYNKS